MSFVYVVVSIQQGFSLITARLSVQHIALGRMGSTSHISTGLSCLWTLQGDGQGKVFSQPLLWLFFKQAVDTVHVVQQLWCYSDCVGHGLELHIDLSKTPDGWHCRRQDMVPLGCSTTLPPARLATHTWQSAQHDTLEVLQTKGGGGVHVLSMWDFLALGVPQ